jgi:hypothetical protein
MSNETYTDTIPYFARLQAKVQCFAAGALGTRSLRRTVMCLMA